jgi:plasmid stability protein
MTIRGVPEEVAARLKKLSDDRGQSVNTTVLEILKRSVGVDERRAHLERYVTWTDQDLEEFQGALACQRVVDDKLWK